MLSSLRKPIAGREPTAAHTRISVSSLVLPSLVVSLDAIVILGTAVLTYAAVVGERGIDQEMYVAASLFVCIFSIIIMQFAGLYQFTAIVRPLASATSITAAFGTAFMFMLAAAFSLKVSSNFSRLWVAVFALSAWVAVLSARVALALVLQRLNAAGLFARNIIVLGKGEQLRALLGWLEKSPPRFSRFLGVFVDDPTDLGRHDQWTVLGSRENILDYTRSQSVDDVFVALPWSETEPIKQVNDRLREMPLNVYLAADVAGFQLSMRPAPDHFGGVPVIELMGRPLAGWGGIWKAVMDYAVGALLLLLLAPAMLLIAFAVRLESHGPALFKQARYGFVNRVFQIYKFRTMKHAGANAGKVIQATRDDPRVTPLGRLLRRTSLDELPQLLNVLNGTMSLVGPRPHAIEHNEEYAQLIRGYFARHRVKPGLTGWAQVNGFRGETKTIEDMEARVKYDIYYVENWSILFDLQILLRTFLIVLTGRNAY